jgi:anti-sigma regulatory factor (Ser/Thr protein kinase)
VALQLLERRPEVSVGEVASHAGLTRQTSSTHLRALAVDGVLEATGAGRGLRFRVRRQESALTFPLEGLEEDRVWALVEAQVPVVSGLSKEAFGIVHFVFTELLNNAIDHSGGTRADIRVGEQAGRFVLEIEDDGEGAFEHVRRLLGLSSRLDALQDLTKGKVTTDPSRHTGQGIFFASRALDRFTLEANRLKLVMDNLVADVAWGDSARERGTLVRGEVAFDTGRRIKDVFDAYSGEDYAFTRSQTWVRLFETGLGFVSRSEAKRLLVGLERFEEVLLDFTKVSAVGQGFADEVFRVWQRSHPGTRLIPKNMTPPVEAMVRRASAP